MIIALTLAVLVALWLGYDLGRIEGFQSGFTAGSREATAFMRAKQRQEKGE